MMGLEEFDYYLEQKSIMILKCYLLFLLMGVLSVVIKNRIHTIKEIIWFLKGDPPDIGLEILNDRTF